MFPVSGRTAPHGAGRAFRAFIVLAGIALGAVAADAAETTPAAEATESTTAAEVAEAPAAAGSASPQGTAAAGDDLERRLRELEEQLAALKAELERTRPASGAPAGLDELERRIEALSKEIERLRLGEAAAPAAGESMMGLGPAASKVYATKRGVVIGGYGEMLLSDPSGRRDDDVPSGASASADLLRAVMYFGYKFNDKLLFNSEIEFEHAHTGPGQSGAVEVEFAYVDYRHSDRWGARGGLLLVPLGFINELHEPPIFFGARRPEVERVIIPTTWRELGAGLYGSAGPITWRAYVVTSLDPTGFTAANGFRGARQSGSEAVAEDFALTARVDWDVAPGLLLGVGAFSGDTAQATVVDGGRLTQAEAHAEWRWRGVQVRGLFVRTSLDDAADIGVLTGQAVGSEMNGYYGEVGWNVLSLRKNSRQELSPFVRYESLDTQAEMPTGVLANPANDRIVRTIGIHYRPIPNLALKADWQDLDDAAGTGVDRLNLALGWLF